jgi:transposase
MRVVPTIRFSLCSLQRSGCAESGIGRRRCRRWAICDGFSGDCRLADVRFHPVSVQPGLVVSVASGQTPVIQASKLGARIMRYELADHEWIFIKPMLPNKPRGVPRVNDRRVLNGIFWVLRSGAPWRDLPDTFGPYTTCYNRFVRWRRAGVWGRIIDAFAAAHDVAVQMIDTSIVRVHQHGACITRNKRQSMGRSRGGLTSKIHAVVDSNGLPVRLALSPGEAHDVRLAGKLLSRLKSGSMLLADRGYDADWIRELATKKGAWANIPPKSNRSNPICFSPYLYRARNRVERFFNRIKQCRRVATRYDRLAANYLAFVQLASIRLWLRVNESAS